MLKYQTQIIRVEEEQKTEAQFMSKSFVNKAVKNRAFINSLGAELVIKYLNSKRIETENLHNLHSISKILEDIDIADVLLPNIHIDVRVVFDDNKIFIPKIHSEYGIEPDIYVVLKLRDEEYNSVELLGFFEPKQIDKNLQNADYYFIENSELRDPETLADYVSNFNGSTNIEVSEDDILKGRELYIAMTDYDISQFEKEDLYKLLLSSDTLRDSILEFDNFETLSYSVAPSISADQEEETSEQTDENNSYSSENKQDSDESNENNSAEIEKNEDEEENLENFFDEQDLVLSNDFNEPDISLESEIDEGIEEISDNKDDETEVLNVETEISEEPDNDNKEENKSENNILSDIASSAVEGIAEGTIIGGSIAAAGAGITGALSASASAAASQEAIDLAAMASETFIDQGHDLGKNADDYSKPLDLSEFNQVEQKQEPELEVENNSVDFNDINSAQEPEQDLYQYDQDLADLPSIENVEDLNIEEEPVNDLSDFENINPDINQVQNPEITDSSEDFSNDFNSDFGEFEDFSNDFESTEETENKNSEQNFEDFNQLTEESKNDFENNFEDENIQTVETFTQDSTDLPEIKEENFEQNQEVLDESQEPTLSEFIENKEEEQEENNETELTNEQNSQEWLSENNEYEELEEIIPQTELKEEDYIKEPEGIINVNAETNSRVISDENFTVGEIPIDINISESDIDDSEQDLEGIYSDEITPQMVGNPAKIGFKPQQHRTGLGAGIMAIVALIAIVGVIGFSISKITKQKIENPQPISEENSQEETNKKENEQLANINKDNVIKMDNVVQNTSPSFSEVKPQTQNTQTKKIPATSFISIRKISWEAPAYVASTPEFKSFFQSSGKSLRLSLNSDLLLAKDYIYSDMVKVGLNFNQDGAFKDSKILNSSGSSEIDKIVLQTVNQTFRVLKAPHSVGSDLSTTLILKIYF